MNLNVKIEGAPDVKAMLQGLAKDAPAAIRMAANEIGEHIQLRMQSQIGSRFTFRGTQSGFQKAIVFAKAIPGRTNRTHAVVKVGSDGIQSTRTAKLGNILARHEEGGTRTTSNTVRLSTGETRNVGFFIPAGLRTPTSNPPRSVYPSAIGAVMVRRTDGGYGYNSSVKKRKTRMGAVIDGYTYTVTEDGIFRAKHSLDGFTNRKGKPDFTKGQPVWWFTKRVRTSARLGLWETASQLFDRHAIGYLVDAIDTVIQRTR
jgi:hypothetical protein